MARRKKPTTLSAQLRERITSSPLSPYELAEASGVDRSVLSRFLAGKRSLTLDTVRQARRRPQPPPRGTLIRQHSSFDGKVPGGGEATRSRTCLTSRIGPRPEKGGGR